MIGRVAGAAAFDPIVNLFFLEFPETADFMGRHVLFAYPLVGGIAFDAKIFSYFVNREPPVFHAFTPYVVVIESLV